MCSCPRWRPAAVRPPPGRRSPERLPNGNHLVAEPDSGRLFDVAPDGEVVWELLNDVLRPDGSRDPIYRVKHYPPGDLPDVGF